MKASVEFEENGNHVEEILTSYSEDDRQQNQINAETAKLVFSPEFIPYYPEIARRFDMSHTETLLYGFLRFYLKNSSGRFYFTSEQLGTILNCTDRTIKRAIQKLRDSKLIQVGHKVKAGGGTIRFISLISERTPVSLPKGQECPPNKNKINQNNLDKLRTSLHDVSLSSSEKKEVAQRLFESSTKKELEMNLALLGEAGESHKEKLCRAFDFKKKYDKIWELSRQLLILHELDPSMALSWGNLNYLDITLKDKPFSQIRKYVEQYGFSELRYAGGENYEFELDI